MNAPVPTAASDSVHDPRAGADRAVTTATLRDVAAVAGVSPRTVSRVVNNEHGHTANTRQRILEAVEKLGYRPNMLARGLITRKSGTVGLVVADMTDSFFTTLAVGVETRVRQQGRTTFFASSMGDTDRQLQVLQSFWSHAVDGMVVSPLLKVRDQLASYARGGMPIVVVDFPLDAPRTASVRFAIAVGARLAVEHFLSTGRQRLAMIGASLPVPSGPPGEEGFSTAVDAADARGHLVRAMPTVQGGMAGLTELLAKHPDIDAVLTYNDAMAIGAMSAAKAHGRRVPEDIAVIGFDDIEMAAHVTPTLTTIRLDRAPLADAVTVALHQLLEDPTQQPEPVVLPVELVVRGSA